MFLMIWPVLAAVAYSDGPLLPALLTCAVLHSLYVAYTTSHKWVLIPALGSVFVVVMLNDSLRETTSDPLAATVNPLVSFWEVGPYILPLLVLVNTTLLALYQRIWGEEDE